MDPKHRDLPEVMAEMLIEQHAIRQAIEELRAEARITRAEARENADRMAHMFEGMTHAVLNAMERAENRAAAQGDEMAKLRLRVDELEKTVYRK